MPKNTAFLGLYEQETLTEAILHASARRKWSLRKLAESTRINASYLSRALKEKANLSKDQTYRIGKALSLTPDEIRFLQLLAERASASGADYRQYLDDQISAAREQFAQLFRRIQKKDDRGLSPDDLASYYDNRQTATVHMALTIPKFAKDPDRLAAYLGLTPDVLSTEIEKLLKFGLIARGKNGQISVEHPVVHLPSDSYISLRNHINWRLKAIANLEEQQHLTGRGYSLSAVFSASHETRTLIEKRFKEWVLQIQKLVAENDDCSDVFYMNFDLYSGGRSDT